MTTATEILCLLFIVPLVIGLMYLCYKKYRDYKNYKLELSLGEYKVETNYNDLDRDYLTMIKFMKLVDEKDKELKIKISE